MNVHPIIGQMVDRQHVGASHRTAIRAVINGLKGKHKTFAAMSPKDRRRVMAQAIHQHDANRALFAHVMG